MDLANQDFQMPFQTPHDVHHPSVSNTPGSLQTGTEKRSNSSDAFVFL